MNLVGLEVNDFDIIKMVAVSRPRTQKLTVDKNGLTYKSKETGIAIHIPERCFPDKTGLQLLVKLY